MGWHSGGNSVERMNYADCVEALNTARNKHNGKPLKSNLRVFDRGTHYAVRLHNTDIVRYYPDGSIELCTDWTTNLTITCIGALTNKWVSRSSLPLFNGRRPGTDKYWRIGDVVFEGVDGYIRFDPSGVVDRSTVKPIDVEIITDKKAVLEAQKKFKSIELQVKARIKLGARCEGAPWRIYEWLEDALSKPLDKIDFSQASPRLSRPEPIWFARFTGATSKVQFSEFTA
jgi:hypothetical protein